jgi:hypothetical protein
MHTNFSNKSESERPLGKTQVQMGDNINMNHKTIRFRSRLKTKIDIREKECEIEIWS